MMFELLLDVLDRFLNLRDSVFVFEISSLQSSYRCAHLHESHRTLRDGFWGGDRGRDKGRLCPSLRTGLADLLHPALQLVVNFQEDRHAAVCACFKEYKPTAEK
jgi:hypothetical protein